jgi:hypothetical protein
VKVIIDRAHSNGPIKGIELQLGDTLDDFLKTLTALMKRELEGKR